MVFLAESNPTDHVTDVILLKIGDFPILTMHMVTILIVAWFPAISLWLPRLLLDYGT